MDHGLHPHGLSVAPGEPYIRDYRSGHPSLVLFIIPASRTSGVSLSSSWGTPEMMWDAYSKAALVSVTPATPPIPHVHAPLQPTKSRGLNSGPKMQAGQCHGPCSRDSSTPHTLDPGPAHLAPDPDALVEVLGERLPGDEVAHALVDVNVAVLEDDLALADDHQRGAVALHALEDVVFHSLHGKKHSGALTALGVTLPPSSAGTSRACPLETPSPGPRHIPVHVPSLAEPTLARSWALRLRVVL